MYKFDYNTEENTSITPLNSLFIFIMYIIGGLFLGQLVTLLVVFLPHIGFEVSRLESLVSNPNFVYADVYFTHALQGVFMLVSFIFAPLLYLQFVVKKDLTFFTHTSSKLSKQTIFIFISVALIFLIYPLSLKIREFTVLGIENGFFGAFGKQMLLSERNQQKMVESMLNVRTIGQTFSLFLVIAALPALGEELIFRGVFQNILIKMKWNPIIAILVSAFIFSGLHFSLTDFVPRLLLGTVLGLSYHYSKNFMIPVLLHFLNNALSIVYYLLLKLKIINFNIESKGAINGTCLVISSIAFVATLYFLILKSNAYFKTAQKEV